jgi:membrane-bound lytic murein transglycosylase B
MKSRLAFIFFNLLFIILFPCQSFSENQKEGFSLWLSEVKKEAIASGLSQKTVNKAFANVSQPKKEIIEKDRKQPEFTQTLNDYLSSRINDRRIRIGQRMLQNYPTWLNRIERRFGVQRRFIVALWGIESSYGQQVGTYPVIQSLVTLAYDNRRASYFRSELLDALFLIDKNIVPMDRMFGSWAGAMGQCQFMPSSYRHYAVDADNSGSINLWASVPDVLGSIANYLSKLGWKNDQTWGRAVKLPESFDYSIVGLDTKLPLSRWHSMGVTRDNGRSLPRRNLNASLIIPDGRGGQAYLVYDNFRSLLSWNRSTLFALSVGLLSDEFIGY